MKENRKVLLTH